MIIHIGHTWESGLTNGPTSTDVQPFVHVTEYDINVDSRWKTFDGGSHEPASARCADNLQ